MKVILIKKVLERIVPCDGLRILGSSIQRSRPLDCRNDFDQTFVFFREGEKSCWTFHWVCTMGACGDSTKIPTSCSVLGTTFQHFLKVRGILSSSLIKTSSLFLITAFHLLSSCGLRR